MYTHKLFQTAQTATSGKLGGKRRAGVLVCGKREVWKTWGVVENAGSQWKIWGVT